MRNEITLSAEQVEELKPYLKAVENALQEHIQEGEAALEIVGLMMGLSAQRMSLEKKEMLNEKRTGAAKTVAEFRSKAASLRLILDQLYPERLEQSMEEEIGSHEPIERETHIPDWVK